MNRDSILCACALALILVFDTNGAHAAKCSKSVTFAISGFNPDRNPGIFLAARCQEDCPSHVRARRLDSKLLEPRAEGALRKTYRGIVRGAQRARAAGRAVHLTGHSWGCMLAIRAAQDLGRETPPAWFPSNKQWVPVSIDTLTCIDGIAFALPTDMAPEMELGLPLVPDNVRAVINVRQSIDSTFRGTDLSFAVPDAVRANILISTSPNDPIAASLLESLQADYFAATGQSLPVNTVADVHAFIDDALGLRQFLGSMIGRPCDGVVLPTPPPTPTPSPTALPTEPPCVVAGTIGMTCRCSPCCTSPPSSCGATQLCACEFPLTFSEIPGAQRYKLRHIPTGTIELRDSNTRNMETIVGPDCSDGRFWAHADFVLETLLAGPIGPFEVRAVFPDGTEGPWCALSVP